MPGTNSNAYPARAVVSGYNNAAVTANLYLREWVCPFNAARIGAIKANGGAAGAGAGNTVIDILKNGTTIFAATADRPTLATASTGEFTNISPSTRALQKGDVLAIQVVTIPATTGHTRVSCSVVVEIA